MYPGMGIESADGSVCMIIIMVSSIKVSGLILIKSDRCGSFKS